MNVKVEVGHLWRVVFLSPRSGEQLRRRKALQTKLPSELSFHQFEHSLQQNEQRGCGLAVTVIQALYRKLSMLVEGCSEVRVVLIVSVIQFSKINIYIYIQQLYVYIYN